MESNYTSGKLFKGSTQKNNYWVIQKLFISCVNNIIKNYFFAYFRKAKKYSKEDHCATEKKKMEKGANKNFVWTISEGIVVDTVKKITFNIN